MVTAFSLYLWNGHLENILGFFVLWLNRCELVTVSYLVPAPPFTCSAFLKCNRIHFQSCHASCHVLRCQIGSVRYIPLHCMLDMIIELQLIECALQQETLLYIKTTPLLFTI